MSFAAILDRQFLLTERGSNLRTEVLAGATYIILVNPAILGLAGMPVASVAAATCFAAGFASILMGSIANTPLALAPGMGLNAYFSFTVVQTMHVPWPIALGCVFISGAIFLVLTLAGIRQMIVAAIPSHLFAAVAAGIGLFIGLIGMKNGGLVVNSPATGLALGNLHETGAILAIIGLVLVVSLHVWRVHAAVLIAIAVTTLLAWGIGAVNFKVEPYSLSSLTQTAFKLDLAGVLGMGGKAGLGILEILFIFLFVDLFDNLGTLMAVTRRAGLIEPAGNIPGLNRMLIADSVATMVGACAGTSTVTSYVESAAGVEVGGRTGVTAIVTGVLFLLAMFAAPYAQWVPAAATAPALILVGALMMVPLADVEWTNAEDAIPAFLTLVGIPFTYSIANGLAFGIAAHALIRLVRGKITRKDWLLLVLAGMFIARFVWLSGAA